MQQGSVVACQRCGAIYSFAAAACPDCGAPAARGSAPLGQLHDAGVAVMRPRPSLRRQRPWASIVAMAGMALVALVATVIWLTTRKEAAPTEVVRVPVPDSVPSAELPKPLDADLALDKARAEATRWNADATLAGVEVGPFVAGKLLPEGTLRAEFGRPAGAHVGPGAGLHKEIFVVTVSQDVVSKSSKNIAGRSGLADPNCIVQDVWRKLLPDVGQSAQSAAAANTTVDATARLTLRYERSRHDGRAVFRVMKEGTTTALRTLDGSNCSFLLR